MLLLIDNYDSFAHNLARYFMRLGCDMQIARNDAVSVESVQRCLPQAIVLSPGPCTPEKAGCSIDLVRAFHSQVPILGVCLGHQAIVAALGGKIVRSEPMHGRTSLVRHDEQGVFEGISNPFLACRYHSLTAERESLPDQLQVSCQTEDGVIMAVRHREYPVVGVQFHPEAILTQHGYSLLANFLRLAQIGHAQPLPSMDSELTRCTTPCARIPKNPITF